MHFAQGSMTIGKSRELGVPRVPETPPYFEHDMPLQFDKMVELVYNAEWPPDILVLEEVHIPL